VQVGTKKLKARPRTATGDERLRLWKKALEFWPPYADYGVKTEREIPVVVLDPVHLGSGQWDRAVVAATSRPFRLRRTAGLHDGCLAAAMASSRGARLSKAAIAWASLARLWLRKG
jgi:hypothetical protein